MLLTTSWVERETLPFVEGASVASGLLKGLLTTLKFEQPDLEAEPLEQGSSAASRQKAVQPSAATEAAQEQVPA